MKVLLLTSFLISGLAWGQFNIGNVPIDTLDLPPEKLELVKNLWKTSSINDLQIYRNLKLEQGRRALSFSSLSPFRPLYIEKYKSIDNLKYPLPENPLSYINRKIIKRIKYYTQEVVVKREANPDKHTYVCAIQFSDTSKTFYKLKTFPNTGAAQNANYIVTHYGKCGMCSSLKDLAVYLAKSDLTTPARKCSKNLGIKSVKSCYKNTLGFSNFCSEQWAYNSENTRKLCGLTCIKYYGLLNILNDRMDRPNTDENGNLNICLACDEYKSGPGFKFGAGRTRRNSGITSAIGRSDGEVFVVDHYRYFEY